MLKFKQIFLPLFCSTSSSPLMRSVTFASGRKSLCLHVCLQYEVDVLSKQFIQPMPTFWKSGSKGKEKRLAFLDILCKHGNYLCKHGNYYPLYKKEIYYMSRITFFPLKFIFGNLSFSSGFFLYFNFKMIKILSCLSIFFLIF